MICSPGMKCIYVLSILINYLNKYFWGNNSIFFFCSKWSLDGLVEIWNVPWESLNTKMLIIRHACQSHEIERLNRSRCPCCTCWCMDSDFFIRLRIKQRMKSFSRRLLLYILDHIQLIWSDWMRFFRSCLYFVFVDISNEIDLSLCSVLIIKETMIIIMCLYMVCINRHSID